MDHRFLEGLVCPIVGLGWRRLQKVTDAIGRAASTNSVVLISSRRTETPFFSTKSVDMNFRTQTKVFRVSHEGRVERLGSLRTTKADATR